MLYYQQAITACSPHDLGFAAAEAVLVLACLVHVHAQTVPAYLCGSGSAPQRTWVKQLNISADGMQAGAKISLEAMYTVAFSMSDLA